MLLRDFETDALSDRAAVLRAVAQTIKAEFPRATIDVNVTKQYRNMADGLKKEPRLCNSPRKRCAAPDYSRS